jgi:uncharacterized protein YecE (DUF72 family)
MFPAKLYLGCPVWAHAPWRGTFFTAGARREDFLPQYASVFGTTEGNATFYGLPSRETVARWAAEAPDAFRFCWKFPRTITHELQLAGAEAATREFLDRMAPLARSTGSGQGSRLGPFFLQLHQSFGPERLRDLENYLRALPAEFSYAVEVRAPEFFAGGAAEHALDALLGERGIDRVIFDTRGLFASRATDELTLDAQRRKPRVPVRLTATGPRPFVRFVGDPEIERNDAALRAWAGVVARWIGEGRTPFFFTHHPDDTFAPALARRFQAFAHEASPAVPPPPAWPAEQEAPAARQLELL